jgi:hypothetical protein
MQMGHAEHTAMISRDRPMMIGVGKREGAEEREPAGQCYCRKSHDLAVHAVDTNNKWTFSLIVLLKSFLIAMGAARGHFCGMKAVAGSRINPQRGHQA